jgi:SAM-dependent methyltransferase
LSKVERQIFIDRIHQFDLQELRDGNLWGGCKSIALQHTVGDIYGEPFRSGQFDLIFSRASLEHFSDLEYAAAALFNSTAPGGINDHLVDFTDHRCYTSPDYHQWSFLAEDGDWLKGVHPANRVNRLRLSDVKGIFERAGFVVEILRSDKKPLPPGLINELHPDFAKYSLSDLETLVARIVAVKP